MGPWVSGWRHPLRSRAGATGPGGYTGGRPGDPHLRYMQTDNAIDMVRTSATNALDRVYLGNTALNWLVALAVLVAIVAVLGVARWLLVRRLNRTAAATSTLVDDYVVALLEDTKYSFILVVALAGALKVLVLPARISELVMPLARLAVIIQVGLWANQLITLSLHRVAARRAAVDVASVTTVRAIGLAGRFLLWLLIFLVVLRSFGVNVTAMVGALGIGGVAIALAVQNVLGDLFASLSIVLDKPFVVGDSLAVDDYNGTVEEIGLKTTRLRSSTGEQLIFSNADLLKSRIRNYRSLSQRRATFNIGIEYGTPSEVVARIPVLVREIITGIDQTRFDRSHFRKLGDSALEFETVYHVLTPDYQVYMDIQQRINLELYERVTALGASFAFPTRTLVIEPSRVDQSRVDRSGAGQSRQRRAGPRAEGPAASSEGGGETVEGEGEGEGETERGDVAGGRAGDPDSGRSGAARAEAGASGKR